MVNRIDRHLVQTHSDIFDEKQRRFCLAFYRCRNAKAQRKVNDCVECFTRFATLVTNKQVNKCDGSTVLKVHNPESRSSLPAEIRAAAKSSFLPSLDVAERFEQNTLSSRKQQALNFFLLQSSKLVHSLGSGRGLFF